MCLPKSAKEEIIEYYSKHNTVTSQLIQTWTQEHLDVKYESPADVKKYVQLMDYLDTTRNTDWKSIIPETWSLLSRHCKL